MWYHANLTYSCCFLLILTQTQIQQSEANNPCKPSVPCNHPKPSMPANPSDPCIPSVPSNSRVPVYFRNSELACIRIRVQIMVKHGQSMATFTTFSTHWLSMVRPHRHLPVPSLAKVGFTPINQGQPTSTFTMFTPN